PATARAKRARWRAPRRTTCAPPERSERTERCLPAFAMLAPASHLRRPSDEASLVMEAAEHGEGDDVPLGRAVRRDRGLLTDPLVRARGVVVADVLGDDAPEGP